MHKPVAMTAQSRSPAAARLFGVAGRLGARVGAIGLSLLLSACNQPVDAPPPAAESALMQEFERIERGSRTQPRQRAQELQALLPRAVAGSPERLEALSLRALMAGRLRDRALLDEVLAELHSWPAPASRSAASMVALISTAHFQQEQGDTREAKKTLQGLDSRDKEELPQRIRQRLESLRGKVLADAGEMDAAVLAGQESLRLADRSGRSWRRALALGDLAWTYYRTQQIDRARAGSRQALAEARLDPDTDTLITVLINHGNLHAEHADADITRQAYAEALQHARAASAHGMQALTLGNFADYHLRRGEFAQALALAEQALPLARQSQSRNAEGLALHNMGIAKIGLKRLAEGTRDVRQAIQLDEQQGAIAYAADGWAELGNHLESAGDWQGAIDAHHHYRRLIDQVLREDTRKALLEAQESFDAERRAKEIELLAHDNSLVSEKIRARDLQLRLWAVVAGCVLLSGLLLALAYQRIRRSNQALAHSNETLKLQSERDPLTGLANRRFFQLAVQRLAEAGKLSAAVYLIDIDLFKRINDQHGHAAGDAVLVEVARRLRHVLREDDLVVRWGGEEFLIVVPERTGDAMQPLAQRLLDSIGSEPVQHGSKRIPVTASIGFASFPVAPNGLALGWERAIDLVDTVMYLAKAHGRNRAYGVLEIQAQREEELLALMPRIEAAWREGQVSLVALQGPGQLQVAA